MEAEELVAGGELFRREQVERLTLALPMVFECPECHGQEVGTRGWPRVCSPCSAQGDWVQMVERE